MLDNQVVPLLLPTHLQYDFLRSCMDKDREYKRSLDSNDLNDSASTSFSMAKGEDFDNKRENHSAMKMNAEIVRRIVVSQPHHKHHKNKASVGSIQPSSATSGTRGSPSNCPCCRSRHATGSPVSVRSCTKFKSLSAKDRYDFAAKTGLCKTCFEPKNTAGHPSTGCNKDWKCRTCGKSNHNDLLCF